MLFDHVEKSKLRGFYISDILKWYLLSETLKDVYLLLKFYS